MQSTAQWKLCTRKKSQPTKFAFKYGSRFEWHIYSLSTLTRLQNENFVSNAIARIEYNHTIFATPPLPPPPRKTTTTTFVDNRIRRLWLGKKDTDEATNQRRKQLIDTENIAHHSHSNRIYRNVSVSNVYVFGLSSNFQWIQCNCIRFPPPPPSPKDSNSVSNTKRKNAIAVVLCYRRPFV